MWLRFSWEFELSYTSVIIILRVYKIINLSLSHPHTDGWQIQHKDLIAVICTISRRGPLKRQIICHDSAETVQQIELNSSKEFSFIVKKTFVDLGIKKRLAQIGSTSNSRSLP